MNPILKVIAKIHATIYHRSKGRFGNQMGGTHILLLHHVGAKSGKKYTTPLGYINNNEESGGLISSLLLLLVNPSILVGTTT